MSSFVFYKIPFEGKIEVLYDFIKTRDWNILVKVPENGILYMKILQDDNEEVLFYQNLVFDKATNSKFGIFQSITELDFEAAQNIETPISIETKDVGKTNKSSQKYNNLSDDKIKDFSDKKKEVKFNVKESFEIVTDNINYEITIAFNEQLMYFEINEKKNIIKEDFNIYISLEELRKIDRFFNQFETLEEVFDSLKTLIAKKNLFIVKERINMKIKIINPANNKEFYINVPLKEKDFKRELNSIIPYINTLNEKVKNLENEVSILKNKLNEIHDIFLYKDNIVQFITDKIMKEKKRKELIESYDIQKSKIINKNEIDLILKWLEYKNPLKITLLLDSKIDSDSIETFLNKCSNKYPTIVFIKTTKNRRFGGYSSIPWKNTEGCFKKDINNFIFSLDKRKKYKILESDKAIITNTHYFAFADGLGGFRINKNSTSNNSSYSKDNNGIYDGMTEKYELNGESNFTVSSYEVYHIEYEE